MKKSVGAVIVAFALAVMLIVMGINTVSLNTSGSSSDAGKFFKGVGNRISSQFSGNEVANSIYYLTKDNRTMGDILVWIVGILEIAAGAMVFVCFFLPMKGVKNILMWIVFALWCVVLVLVDVTGNNGICGNAFKDGSHVLSWLASLSSHVLILGAILVAKDN